MLKPDSLCAALTAAIPHFRDNPDALKMFVDKGRIVASRGAANRAFEYRYTLNLIVEDWQGEECLIFLALNEWLETQQPALLAAAAGDAGAYTFEVDIIDEKTIDLSIEIQLTEAVRVMPRAGGGYNLTFVAEENPLFADAMPISTPPAPLTDVFWQDERLIPGPPLDAAP